MPDARKRFALTLEIVVAVSQRFWEKVDVQGDDDCWEWQVGRARTRDGELTYGTFFIRRVPFYAHRIAFMLTYGREPYPFGLHTCDNPPCCNPKHIVEGTQKDNMEQCSQRGRINKDGMQGIEHHAAKLSDQAVLEILEMAKQPQKHGWKSALARKLKVTPALIGHVLHGRAWTHLRGEK